MNQKFTVLAFVIIAAFLATTLKAEEFIAPEQLKGTIRVNATQLVDLIVNTDEIVVIDSRKPEDREGGYIEDSIALPDFNTTPLTLAEIIPTLNTPIAFYCNGIKCKRSSIAANIAVEAGYSTVYWFRGGWEEWLNAELPIVKD